MSAIPPTTIPPVGHRILRQLHKLPRRSPTSVELKSLAKIDSEFVLRNSLMSLGFAGLVRSDYAGGIKKVYHLDSRVDFTKVTSTIINELTNAFFDGNTSDFLNAVLDTLQVSEDKEPKEIKGFKRVMAKKVNNSTYFSQAEFSVLRILKDKNRLTDLASIRSLSYSSSNSALCRLISSGLLEKTSSRPYRHSVKPEIYFAGCRLLMRGIIESYFQGSMEDFVEAVIDASSNTPDTGSSIERLRSYALAKAT